MITHAGRCQDRVEINSFFILSNNNSILINNIIFYLKKSIKLTNLNDIHFHKCNAKLRRSRTSCKKRKEFLQYFLFFLTLIKIVFISRNRLQK